MLQTRSPRTAFGVPTLTSICQCKLLDLIVDHGCNPRLINDLAKSLILLEHLLEPILQALIKRNAITDIAFLAFMNPHRSVLDIPGLSGIRNSTLKMIGYRCTNLISLNASNSIQISNSIISCILQGCHLLKELVLDNCSRVTDAAFDPSRCPFDRLRAADTLEIISLRGCRQISGCFSDKLAKVFRRLTSLNCSQCKQLRNSSVMGLVNHGSITSLDLSFIESLDDTAFLGDSFPKNVQFCLEASTKSRLCPFRDEHSPVSWLSLSQSKISDRSLVYIADVMKNLTTLKLQWCGAVTDDGIGIIVRECLFLKELDLQSCNVSDAVLKSIASNCAALEYLDVSWCSGISDTGLTDIAFANTDSKLLRLKYLKTTWCSHLTEVSVAKLVYLESLRVFEFFGFKMSDVGIDKFKERGILVKGDGYLDGAHSE